MPKTRKPKLTKEDLLAQNNLPSVDEMLPVSQLPEVRANVQRILHGRMPGVKRVARAGINAVLDPLAIVGHVMTNGSVEAPQGDTMKISPEAQKRMSGSGKKLARRIADIHGGRAQKQIAAKVQAEAEFRQQNPDIAQHEKELQNAAVRRERVQKDSVISRIYTDALANGNIYTFAKAIPRLKEQGGQLSSVDEYGDLAGRALTVAMEGNKEGLVQLMGAHSCAQRLRRLEDGSPTRTPLVAEDAVRADEASQHNGGVATLLWKMGLLQFDSEKHIPYGHGKFSDLAQWSTPDHKTTRVSLPYDADNEYHRLFAEGMGVESPTSIQFDMSSPFSREAPYLSMRLSEAQSLEAGIPAAA